MAAAENDNVVMVVMAAETSGVMAVLQYWGGNAMAWRKWRYGGECITAMAAYY